MQNQQYIKVYEESHVLSEVWQHSAPLRAFYATERGKITRPIQWSAPLPGMQTLAPAAVHVTPQVATVFLMHIPIQLDDVESLVHELTHLVLGVEGCPGVRALQNQYGVTLSSYFGDLFQEAMVSARLQALGFDILAIHPHYQPEAVRATFAREKEPTERLKCIVWALNLIIHALVYQQLTGVKRLEGVFDEVCEQWQRVGKLARWMMGEIETVDWQTPQQQQVLYKRIFDRYSLHQVVKVVAP